MYCKRCGNQVDDNSKFCPVCGQNLETGLQPKTTADLWLVLTICSVLLLILSISMAIPWGDIPLSKLDIEDTLPSALLSIGSLFVSGFNLFSEKKKRDSNNVNHNKYAISVLVFIACVFVSVAVCLLPLFGALQ